MNRRIISYLVFLVFFLAIWFLFGAMSEETRYHGRTAQEWRMDFEIPATRDAARDALLHLGTNETSALIKRIQSKDSTIKSDFLDYLSRLPWLKFSYLPAEERRYQAAIKFGRLGPGTRAAFRPLTNLLNNPDPEIVGAACFGLSMMGNEAVTPLINMLNHTNADVRVTVLYSLNQVCKNSKLRIFDEPAPIERVLPVLLQRQNETNSAVFTAASWSLSDIHARPDLLVPILVSNLTHTNPTVRYYAIESLSYYGKDSQPAVPGLIKLLADTHPRIHNGAANILKTLDPAAAAQAGVK